MIPSREKFQECRSRSRKFRMYAYNTPSGTVSKVQRLTRRMPRRKSYLGVGDVVGPVRRTVLPCAPSVKRMGAYLEDVLGSLT